MDPQAGCESATWRRRSWESGRRSRQCSAAPRAAGRCTSGRDGEPYPLQMFSSSHKHFRQLLQIPACVSVSEQDWESMGSHRSPMPPPTTTSPPRHQGGTECSLHPHTHGAGGLLCPLACTRCHHQTQMLSQVLWGVLQLRSPRAVLNHLSLAHTRADMSSSSTSPILRWMSSANMYNLQSALLSHSTTMGF